MCVWLVRVLAFRGMEREWPPTSTAEVERKTKKKTAERKIEEHGNSRQEPPPPPPPHTHTDLVLKNQRERNILAVPEFTHQPVLGMKQKKTLGKKKACPLPPKQPLLFANVGTSAVRRTQRNLSRPTYRTESAPGTNTKRPHQFRVTEPQV